MFGQVFMVPVLNYRTLSVYPGYERKAPSQPGGIYFPVLVMQISAATQTIDTNFFISSPFLIECFFMVKYFY